MPKVVVTVQVEDAVKWEAGLRRHGALFRSQTVTTPIGIAINDGNEVAICAEPSDLSTFMEIFNSPATADAMAQDGVKRETAKLYVFDKEFQP
jgi:hypothetical protein